MFCCNPNMAGVDATGRALRHSSGPFATPNYGALKRVRIRRFFAYKAALFAHDVAVVMVGFLIGALLSAGEHFQWQAFSHWTIFFIVSLEVFALLPS